MWLFSKDVMLDWSLRKNELCPEKSSSDLRRRQRIRTKTRHVPQGTNKIVKINDLEYKNRNPYKKLKGDLMNKLFYSAEVFTQTIGLSHTMPIFLRINPMQKFFTMFFSLWPRRNDFCACDFFTFHISATPLIPHSSFTNKIVSNRIQFLP